MEETSKAVDNGCHDNSPVPAKRWPKYYASCYGIQPNELSIFSVDEWQEDIDRIVLIFSTDCTIYNTVVCPIYTDQMW